MKYFATITFIIALTFACSDSPGYSGEAAAEGKSIYTKYCVACHGADGQLQLNGAKNFRDSELSYDERIAIIANGRNLMTPFKGILTEEEIKATAAYTMELSKAK